jgi:type II secretion system protein G
MGSVDEHSKRPAKSASTKTVRIAIGFVCLIGICVMVIFARMREWPGYLSNPVGTIARSIQAVWFKMTGRGKMVTAALCTRAATDCQTLQIHVLMFEVFNNRLPTNAEGLRALVSKPQGTQLPKWRQMMNQLPLDPWGRAYQIRSPAVKSAGAFEIFSFGPDGILSGDDIGTW